MYRKSERTLKVLLKFFLPPQKHILALYIEGIINLKKIKNMNKECKCMKDSLKERHLFDLYQKYISLKEERQVFEDFVNVFKKDGKGRWLLSTISVKSEETLKNMKEIMELQKYFEVELVSEKDFNETCDFYQYLRTNRKTKVIVDDKTVNVYIVTSACRNEITINSKKELIYFTKSSEIKEPNFTQEIVNEVRFFKKGKI